MKRVLWDLLWIAIAVVIGYQIGLAEHPYTKCVDKGFTNPVDIGECIWLLQNQASLR